MDSMGRRRSTAIALSVCALMAPAAVAAADDGPLTHEQVIKRGDVICYDMTTHLKAATKLHRPYSPFSVYHDNLAALARHTVRFSKRGVRRFEPLIRRAPADGEKWRLKTYVRGMRRQLPRIRRLARAADAGNRQKVEAIAYTIGRYTRKYRRHARAYGFADCGHP